MSTRSIVSAVYKSLLRTCSNGKYPEVFGQYASKNGITLSTIPYTPKDTRVTLRNVFQNANYPDSDMFNVMRECNELSSILHPKISHLPPVIPIFDYSLLAALIGEEIRFNFFEPRYVKLAKDATSSDGDGMFILRSNKTESDTYDQKFPHVSVLVKIIEHQEIDDRIIVRCIAGPRMKILKEESVDVQQNAHPLARATEFEMDYDDGNVGSKHVLVSIMDLMALREQCLSLLIEMESLRGVSFVRHGVPPLNIQDFSFWSLKFALPYNDVQSRLHWLSSKSTNERLQFVVDMLLKVKNWENRRHK
eukprot:216245_1